MLCCAYYNTVLCYYNAVLCYYSTVVCYYNVVVCYYSAVVCYYNAMVCYYNVVVCYYNNVLCFSNQIRPISKDFSDHFSYSYSQIQCRHKQTHRKFEGFSTVGKQYTTILSQLLPLYPTVLSQLLPLYPTILSQLLPLYQQYYHSSYLYINNTITALTSISNMSECALSISLNTPTKSLKPTNRVR